MGHLIKTKLERSKGGRDGVNIPIADGDLGDAERQLEESLAQREREQRLYPRGRPNGTPEEREHDREWRAHQAQIEAERRRLEDIQRRLDEMERRRREQEEQERRRR